MTDMPTPDSVIKRYRRAKTRRAPWEAHWQECYDLALPQRDGFNREPTPGEKKTDRLFDGTAPDAVDQLAASLLAELTPPWARWFALTAGPDLSEEETVEAGVVLDRTAATLQSHFDRSNLAVEMLLEPTNIVEGRLDPDRMRPYEDALAYSEGNRQPVLMLAGRRLVSVSSWWDPSFGAPGAGDGCVIAAVYTDSDGAYWLHRVRYLIHDPARVHEVDEATQLCRQVADFARDLHLPAVTLETNGVGRFLPGLLRRELARARVPAAVIEVTSRRPKSLRIAEAFDAVLAAGALHAHRSVWDTPFVVEMREWRPEGRGPDDGLDAVAGCLSSEPVRLSRLALPDRRDWRPGGSAHTALSDFEV